MQQESRQRASPADGAPKAATPAEGAAPASERLNVPPLSQRLDAGPQSQLDGAPLSQRLDGTPRPTLCGWTLRRSLGAGLVCESWLAERAGRKEPAVVRRLHPDLASNDAARTEWLRASWAANRFEHPRVPKVLEEGTDEKGAPVIVRRWVKGESLGSTVARQRLDRATTLRMGEQLLDALEMAHAHGILHGAITPSNIIFTPRGSVRLVDFATTPGLLARRAEAESVLGMRRITAFSPPERRAATGPATEQSDIWSLAACLYFGLTGSPPEGTAPSLRRAAPEVDANVAAVVDLALAHAPYDRYDSAYAMLGDIRRLMAGSPPKLEAALAPVPSQGMPDASSPPPSIGPQSLAVLPAPVSGASEPSPKQRSDPEWRGNLLLMIAIALLVGVASFVMFREKLAESPTTGAPPTHQAHAP